MARPSGLVLDYFRYGNGDVDVYRKVGRAWQLWVLVRDSVLISGGKGLFAAKSFARDEFVGRYVGEILGKAADARVRREAERRTLTVDGDAIVNIAGFFVDGRRPVQSNAVQLDRFGTVVLPQPQWGYPGAYVHICNDARGTGRPNNCRLTFGGYLEATRAVPAYRFDVPHSRNAASELVWSYGGEYWRTHTLLGTGDLPLLVE